MSEGNQGNYQKSSDLERAKQLRREAMFLEQKERIRSRLKRLIAISQDTEYDKYLAQMLKDLESGKATPFQVEREAERSYEVYRQRLAKGMVQRPKPLSAVAAVKGSPQTVKMQPDTQRPEAVRPVGAVQPHIQRPEAVRPVEAVQHGQTVPGRKAANYEFKIGAQVFSLIGAVFVLIAFMIFGFHFAVGIWQGLCLYVAALALVLLSELLFARRNPVFSNVITGIGIGGLYVANLINYLVLDTINGIAAMMVTLLIAVASIMISRKKDSTSIRIISLIGSYICFFPVEDFGTSLQFLVVAAILLVINIVSMFLQNEKNQIAIYIFHVSLNVVFTAIITGMAWAEKIDAVYLILYVVTSFVFLQMMCIRQCRREKNALYVITCVGSGIFIFLIFLIGNIGPGLELSDFKMLSVHLITKVLIVAISVVAFLLWEKEDGRRWAHVYYPAMIILGLKSEYNLDVLLSVLLVFFVVKLLAKHKEILVLDGIVTAWTALTGLAFVDFNHMWADNLQRNLFFNGEVCLLIVAVAMLVSVFFMRADCLYLYHEFVISVFLFLTVRDVAKWLGIEKGWFLVMEAVLLFLLFLLFHHLPRLKGRQQLAYNVVSVSVMSLLYLLSGAAGWPVTTVMMVLGAVVILVIVRKRYELAIPKKPLLLAGFLTYFALIGDYGSPVVGSILLMIIALGCVGIGFKLRDKVERICGLVMAAFVCVKLVVFDFRQEEAIYRMIVFLVVGVLALVISFIYIKLERNEDKEEKAGSLRKMQMQDHNPGQLENWGDKD